MYLRLVHVRIKPETLPSAQRLYNERIASRLQGVRGCLYAGLMLSEQHQEECVSMTLWDSLEHADGYVKSGLFRELVGEAEPYLSGTSEWKIRLSKELELEYQSVPLEPIVKSYKLTARTDSEVPPQDSSGRMYLRIVSVRVQPKKMNELRAVYAGEIIPALLSTTGCRYAYLTEGIEETDEAISVTIWNSKEDADSYEREGGFSELLSKVRHTFLEVYQWKMALRREFNGEVVSSGDYDIEGYSIVSGRRFQ